MRQAWRRTLAVISLAAVCAQSLGVLSAVHHAVSHRPCGGACGCEVRASHVGAAWRASAGHHGHSQAECLVCQTLVAGKVFAVDVADVAVSWAGECERACASENHPTISGANDSISLRGPPIA
jgi:hypothetical protein